MKTNYLHFRFVMPFFIVIIIDAIGLGIVAPLLAPLINQAGSFLGHGLYLQHVIYGLILAIFPLSYMFGAPLLGALSDLWGRKKVLLICLCGALIGFVFYILSFAFANVVLLMLARLIAGFTSGSQGVAQAAMADISKGQEKTINIGIIAVAMTLGLFAGPFLAGILSNSHLISWFNILTPFYFVLILGVINLFLLIYRVHDQYQVKRSRHIFQFNYFVQLFLNKKLRLILSIFFLFELGWSLYFQSLALFLAQRFHFQAQAIGLFSTYLGLVLCFGLIFFVRMAAKRYQASSIIYSALILGCISLVLLFFINQLIFQYVFAIPITAVVALVYSNLISIASDQVDEKNQGLLMGITDAILALAFAITGFLAGWLAYFSIALPFLIAAIFWLIAFIFACFQRGEKYEIMS